MKTNTEEIKIEKGVPFECPRNIQAKFTEAMKRMKIGDSFEMADTITNRNSIYQASRRAGCKVSCRLIDSDKRICRVWRTK